MEIQKITQILTEYKNYLESKNVCANRIQTNKTFGDYKDDIPSLLSHALYLVNGALITAQDPEKYGKLNRHLTAIQMCLSFAKAYTLDELMAHNRP